MITRLCCDSVNRSILKGDIGKSLKSLQTSLDYRSGSLPAKTVYKSVPQLDSRGKDQCKLEAALFAAFNTREATTCESVGQET